LERGVNGHVVGFIVGEPVDFADDAVGNLRGILISGQPLPIDG
jgi:hypothetical protein